MSESKVPYIGKIIVFFVAGSLVLTGCSSQHSENQSVPVCCTKNNEKEMPIGAAKVYLETSRSMSGYVNGMDGEMHDFPLKKLPLSLTTISGFSDTLELYTIAENADRFNQSLTSFNQQLATGDIFQGNSSPLQKIMASIIDSLKGNDIALFVSDCIVDLGDEGLDLSNLSIVTNQIYEALNARPEMAALVYQFNSDFNGDYYYNADNNYLRSEFGVLTGARENRYGGQMMHNRPYYVWVLGGAGQLKQFEKQEVFEGKSAHSYAYGIGYDCCDLEYDIVPHALKGLILLREDQPVVEFSEFGSEEEIAFAIGINLNGLPEFASERAYLTKNITVTPDHAGARILKIERLDELKKSKNYSAISSRLGPSHNLTHFVTLSFPEIEGHESPLGDYQLCLKKEIPNWVVETNLTDDRLVSLQDLENKTFGFSCITEAFEESGKESKYLFKLPFYIQ